MGFGDNPRRPKSSTPRGKLDIFSKRPKGGRGIDWRDVDHVLLKAAIAQATINGATLSFTPAGGGAGIMVKVWKDNDGASEFAGNCGEVNELLLLLIENLASPAEDWRAIYADRQKPDMAAD